MREEEEDEEPMEKKGEKRRGEKDREGSKGRKRGCIVCVCVCVCVRATFWVARDWAATMLMSAFPGPKNLLWFRHSVERAEVRTV